MAPKKSASNGFMIFTFEWKAKYGKTMSIRDATAEAGLIWSQMGTQERAPYNEKAKKEKCGIKDKVEKLTCTGTPVALVEKEKLEGEQRERQMKRNIEMTVRNSVKKCDLENQSFYFIMVNYFTKTLKGGVYVPAELSMCEYSLKDGVSRSYHTTINPGVNIYGHQYEAQHHSETTHLLPLPPKALGERNLGRIYNDVLNFVRCKETGEYAPLYTNRDSMPIVESVLDFLKADVGASNVDMDIYSIQYLFYILKEATCEVGEVDKPKSFYITDAYFERDFFEYQTGIACQYHEDNDRSKYCTQSCVTRWGYMFSDYMCRDIAISLIPGRHVPINTNLNAIVNPAPSTCNDTASFISMATDTSYATKALSEHKIYYDDQKSHISDQTSTLFSGDDFPNISEQGSRKKSSNAKTTNIHSAKSSKKSKELNTFIDSDDTTNSVNNPWASRSRNVPPQPDISVFDIDYTQDERTHDLSDCDEYNTMASFGRGRAANRSLNTTNTSSYGRGRNINHQ